METYTANDQWTTETYVIPGTGSNLNLTPAPPIREIDTMGNEVVPEFIADQGLYYPAAANYYGYYCTGLESPCEWNDHHRFFGTDGHDLQSPGLQTESLQYVYYSPSYGYAQSPYNPYNPFIPGAAVVAPDGPFLGMQQYMPSPAYHQPVSSPAYFPVVVQPGLDGIPTVAPDQSLVNGGALVSSAPETAVVRYMFPTTSVDTTSSVPREASQVAIFHSMSKLSEGPQTHVSSIKPAASQGITAPASSQQIFQGRNGSGSVQTFDNFSQGNGSSGTAPSKVNAPSYYGLSGFGSNVRGWSTGDKLRSRYTFTGGLNNGNGNTDLLGEQNRGPRTNKPSAQSTASIVVKAYTSKAGCVDEQGNIRINIDQYNRTNFAVNYPSAKFFVIKSYSEDDVHKSIKYNVWSSTPNGNKRLDVAYEGAQRISGGNKSFCPVFLFFSVNASGQFCGVAEMTGPVDVHKDMDFWQQDKWNGSFPVKWHIVKDVPNTSFRHIILENNENKPVTNSRDTQEILYIPGLNMLSIFKDSPMRTSVLDDFIYYEDRQRIMHEEKFRLLGRRHASSIPIAASVPPSKVSVTIKAPPKQDEKPAGSSIVVGIDDIKAPSKQDEKPTRSNSAVNVGNIKSPIKQDEKRTDSNNAASIGNHGYQITSETINAGAANGKKDASSDSAHDSNAMAVLKEMELLSIGNSSDGSGNHSAALVTSSSQLDIFTVGSMPVKVNGFGESSEILTIGTISIDPKAVLENSRTIAAPTE